MKKWTEKVVIGSVALLAVVAMISGCVVEQQDDEFERPSDAQDIVGDDILERIEEAGQEVYGGSTPPDIEGDYQIRNGEVVFDERWEDHTGNWCDSTRSFSPTDNPDRYDSDVVLEGSCSGEQRGDALYISGSGSCFTLYSSESGPFGGCERDLIRVISGCLVDDGIEDYSVAQIATDISGDSCQELIDDRNINGVDYLRLFRTDLARKVE